MTRSLWVIGRGLAAPLYPREAGRELGLLLKGMDLALWEGRCPDQGGSPEWFSEEPHPCSRNSSWRDSPGCQGHSNSVAHLGPHRASDHPQLGVPGAAEGASPAPSPANGRQPITYWVKVVLIIREPFKQEATWRRQDRFQEEEQEGTGAAPESRC